MLSSTVLRSTTHARQPSRRPLATRCISSGVPRHHTLVSTHKASKASGASHKDADSVKASEKEDALTTPGPTSTVPTMVRGDWVLFHPVYSSEELKAVEVLHRKPKTFADKIAAGLVALSRKTFDLVSGYKHKELPPDYKQWPIEKLRQEGYILDDRAWLRLTRVIDHFREFLFLESIAGVPGMVAATLRHLQSLRLMVGNAMPLGSSPSMCYDVIAGWIHTCLEEAENERMHLMTFMTLRKPSLPFRAMVLGAQGVFYNLFFMSPLRSDILKKRQVVTYTKCIKDLEDGLIPEWENMPAPEISIDYWRLPADAKMIDIIYAVRSDESTHRFVNHSFANLNPGEDVNPFALREPDMHTKGKKIEFKRDESEAYIEESHRLLGKK
ncbi:mitochondrial alternative oxidase [Ephemerocybe angulata]|uniref:Alternative oxidase n=1 Tax=Ephemerocybe angulata TaxID=980116 RepID=A0A8H6I217_9AGAR|nr:mitochondrial alternative oxidase [Tulosesus angulatus]